MKERKSYHHGDLRAALLHAGTAMLESRGPEALSMRELARAVGVSNNAPRRHFANKQYLLEALAMDGFERLGDDLRGALAVEEPSFERRLIGLAHAHIRFATGHRALFRLMFAAKQHPHVSPELLGASYRALSAGPETMAYGQQIGRVTPGDPERQALIVFAAVEGLLSFSVDGSLGGVPVERLAEQAILQIIVGLQPRND